MIPLSRPMLPMIPSPHDSVGIIRKRSGHSLGAGTAILLKIFFSSEADEVVNADVVEGGETMENKERSLEGLNAGRPVHVECFAFAPPPVFFGEGGSADTPDMYSFINA